MYRLKPEDARKKVAELAASMYTQARKSGRVRSEHEVWITEKQFNYLLSLTRQAYGRCKDESWLSLPGYTAVFQFGRYTLIESH